MSEILVGEYLFRRLKEIGVETVMWLHLEIQLLTVKSDLELALLNLIPEQGLSWVGRPTQLVGAYAADGYACEKGAGALVTTFGLCELSALCGIGGAFCENVPVLHIVRYTLERYFNGMEAPYNDVPMWDYGSIFRAMSPETKVKSYRVDKAKDLDVLLDDVEFQTATYPQCVDMMLSPKDIPSNLRRTFDIKGKEATAAAKDRVISLSGA
ncbi:hypothetical protein VP1G_05076 [Cytospora mali]|uniref:Thiamine pyrophosphate enzyme N-terminal TPP-binding domain-containing protein n=1 Tax=Cytospora mali TaxID=578113 RepID=A0A194V1L4_CYTMA|nr:hypothetical protein VP1G_05076 [Valsa mali var. pyri (nom. inval.)]